GRSGRMVSVWAPPYSRQLVYKALWERVSTPAGFGQRRQAEREPITTADMAASLRVQGRTNHSITVCGPLDYPERDLPVAPYTLGAWLGDGYQVTKHQAPLNYGIAERGTGSAWHQARAGIKAHLRELGVLGRQPI